jgi:hypothetical protein
MHIYIKKHTNVHLFLYWSHHLNKQKSLGNARTVYVEILTAECVLHTRVWVAGMESIPSSLVSGEQNKKASEIIKYSVTFITSLREVLRNRFLTSKIDDWPSKPST